MDAAMIIGAKFFTKKFSKGELTFLLAFVKAQVKGWLAKSFCIYYSKV